MVVTINGLDQTLYAKVIQLNCFPHETQGLKGKKFTKWVYKVFVSPIGDYTFDK
jgi:hypothetical protein